MLRKETIIYAICDECATRSGYWLEYDADRDRAAALQPWVVVTTPGAESHYCPNCPVTVKYRGKR